jgi:hypothetical protein
MNPLLAWWMFFGAMQAALWEPLEPLFQVNKEEEKNG